MNDDKSKSDKIEITETSTRRSRILPDTQVETLRADTINGYSVTVNRHNGDNEKLQVFIDNPALDTSIVKYVSLGQLNEFIAQNTR